MDLTAPSDVTVTLQAMKFAPWSIAYWKASGVLSGRTPVTKCKLSIVRILGRLSK